MLTQLHPTDNPLVLAPRARLEVVAKRARRRSLRDTALRSEPRSHAVAGSPA